MAAATRPGEQTLAAAIGEIAEKLEAAAIKGPVLVLIGRAMESAMRDAADVEIRRMG
jgi:siroheme synthase